MNRVGKWSWLLIVMAVFLLVFLTGCHGGTLTQPDGKVPAGAGSPLTVKVLDVGQGDAILIRTKDQVALIDTGDVPAREKLISMLKSEGITTIDKLIITHPHADHMGGAAAIFEQFTVKQVYDSGQKTNSNLYKQYLTQIKKKNIPFTVVAAGMTIDLGGETLLKVLAPEQPFIGGSDSDLNNNSVVTKLVYKNFSLLLTGDAEAQAEERMLKRDAAGLKSTLLKSGHHGSNTSSSVPFLQAVKPEAALISLGANNEYHHPHPSTLKKYKENKIKIYRTDTDGTLTVASDGNTYTITKER
ncbi:ComEC/Rec2 family competence protein [Sporomusa acidovorans]|uniref:ComE operon protein 3 n=1 Tax=Sporomusa acidovorans (strain ATCC 49682 / DSM 3132 / Mol) TaxID=1123286 RepID=A0ABZ3IZK0_SPOA4|nr:ComEC/Rec2 family competence protein [Sporomusa acidovorans]OZC19164.1 hydroxyacylglutathione hydrolase [Sporomusa acidovorans DSM 3132]SDF11892.1 competence protein ComEC [Sporomusa acidovorans]